MTAPHTTAEEKAARDRAKGSLMDALGAVQQAIAAMPEAAPEDTHFTRDAFMRTDPALTILNKQILDARSQMAKLVAMFGLGDPMVEALTLQITALEAAYAERMALLKRKREESTRKNISTHKLWAEGNGLRDVRTRAKADCRQNNGARWLWAFLILRNGITSPTKSGHVPNAA